MAYIVMFFIVIALIAALKWRVLIIIGILIAAYVIYYNTYYKAHKEEIDKENEKQRQEKERKDIEPKISIPAGLPKVRYYGGYNKKLSDWLLFENNNQSILFYDKKENLKVWVWKEDILSFSMNGEYRESMQVTGGEVKGGGVSVGGALVGAAVAGSVGAIIGSRKKIESTPIKSTTTVTDTRKVILKFKENGVEQGMILDKGLWETLCFMCPEKKIQ